ncbi:BA14K family protein [Rhizobium sp. YTU87027]|uniref:BA14K family protein n=1 Tax=Rhizobium sp. YTU87027 TaxID=3417741 RepID=UPI003D691730
MHKLTLAAFGLITGFSGITPCQAFPAISPPQIGVPQQAVPVQWRHGGGHWNGGHYGGGYWNGGHYGGYHHHHGSDWGLALGGLAFGAIIGGALAQPYYGPYYDTYYGSPYGYYRPYRQYYGPSVAYEGGSHVSWCYARYRTYRAFDNTYQPYYGPRRQCIGPY